MINRENLRIGNYVTSAGKVFRIEHGWQIDEAHQFDPIPIKEKSLFSMGAIGYDNNTFVIRVNDGGGWEDFTLSPHSGFDNFHLEYSIGRNTQRTSSMLIGYVEFIHELQNIIYLLSGKEMEII